MTNFSLKTRLILVGVLPCCLIVSGLLYFVNLRMNQVLENDLSVLKEALLTSHKSELEDSLDMVKTLIAPYYQDSATGDTPEKSDAIKLLSRISYGEDGYFFGYDGNSVRVFSGLDTNKIGESFKDYKDVNGVLLINELVLRAKDGSGFVTYHFPRQNGDTAYPKLSYAIWLEKWNLMIGTGFYIDNIDTSVAAARIQAENYISSTLWQITIAGILMALIVIVLTYWIISRSLKPLAGLVQSLETIAKGGGDLTRRLVLTSNDEIGRVVKAFNTFVDTIHHLVSEVQKTTKSIATNSLQLAEVTNQSFTILDNQRDQTLEVASAINQLSAAALEVAQSSQHVSSAVSHADSASTEAQKTSNESMLNAQQLSEDVRLNMESLQKLKDDVNGIGAISLVIRDIAEQTNLLALNASIEAARAGEQGRGFAVVADEVRALAARTQVSTLEIQQKTKQLETSTQSVSDSISRSLHKGDISVEKSSATVEALNDIHKRMEIVSQQGFQIVTATEEQSQVIESINKSVHKIADATKLANEYAAKSHIAGEELLIMGNQLSKLVDQFKT